MSLAPDRATREQLRAACDAINADLANRRWRLMCIGAAAIVAALVTYATRPELAQFVALAGAMITVGYGLRARHVLGREYKQGLALRIVPMLRDGLTFDPAGSVGVDEFNALHLFGNTAEDVDAEDELRGAVNGVSYAVEEVRATYTTTSSNGKTTQRTTHTIFHGVVVRLEFNKHFHGHTVVVPESFGAGFLGGLFEGELRTIALENAEFERAFIARSTDEVEARYLLTPRFMEVVLEARNALDAEIRLAFHADTLHVLVPGPVNRFEVSLFRGVSPAQAVTELEEVLSLAERLIATFDLETRIWTRT